VRSLELSSFDNLENTAPPEAGLKKSQASWTHWVTNGTLASPYRVGGYRPVCQQADQLKDRGAHPPRSTELLLSIYEILKFLTGTGEGGAYRAYRAFRALKIWAIITWKPFLRGLIAHTALLAQKSPA